MSDGTEAGIARRGVVAAGALIPVGLLVAACSGGGSGGDTASGAHAAGTPSVAGAASASPSPTYPAPTVTTVPANGASNVDPSQAVTVTVANGTISSVELSGGQQTSGTLSTDKATWTSSGTLGIDSSYQIQVAVTGQDGKQVTQTVSFSTLRPTSSLGVSEMWPGDGMSVGVGQPIRVEFTNYVPAEYRAAVEKACVVTATPPVAGAWYWSADNMMDWRPQQFWATGSKVSVALGLEGVRAGEHQFGEKNHSLDFTVRDTDLRLIVDAKAFKATCYINGAVARTFPIDTGMPEEIFITWQGTFAVLGQGNPVDMKGDYGPNDTYNELVYWATQITYSGTYVHDADWDPDIGFRNDDSHGCIHCHPVDAEWFYHKAQVGDVVQVTGTDKPAAVSNGFADWSLSWPSWLAGSAYKATLGGVPVAA
jgi:lipoprotein-anchoring transpeptidase ErfK/SrfK